MARIWLPKITKLHNMYKNIIIVIFYLLGLEGMSQDKWNLKQCISYGIDNNLEIKNSDLSGEMSELNYSQSKWSFLPNIYANSTSGKRFGKSVDPNTNAFVNSSFFENSTSLYANLDVFNGFSQINRLAYQRFLMLSAKDNKKNLEDQIAFEVMNAFYDVIYFQKLLDIVIEQKKLSELNFKKTNAMVSAGLKSQADLLEVKANLEKDELTLIQTQNNLESAKISLRKAINIDMNTELEIDTTVNPSVLLNLTDLNENSIFNRFSSFSPQLQSLETTYQASIKNVSIQKASFYPSISVSASYGTGFYETNKDPNGKTYDFNYQYKNNLGQYVGLSVYIPIFSGNEARFNVIRSKLEMEQNKNNYDKAKRDIQYEISENINALVSANKEYSQLQQQRKADKMAFKAAQKKYDRGMLSVVDFFNAKNRLGRTEANLLRARLTAEARKNTIEFYKGIRFWENQMTTNN